MRLVWFVTFLIAIALTACTQTSSREHPDARQAGRDAYQATQQLKHDAKEAARELENAEQKFREGWNEASREDNRKTEPPRQQRTPPPDEHPNR